MFNKIFRTIIIIGIIVGIVYGVSISSKKSLNISTSQIENSLYDMMQTRPAELVSFYTYGKSFGFTGKLANIDKDNLENVKVLITDGKEFERELNMDADFVENDLVFSVREINNTLILDDLDYSKYYVLIRIKLNNSVNPRYYSFVNNTKDDNIDYYTVRSVGESEKEDKKGNVYFINSKYKGKEYNLMYLQMEEADIPEDVYDIVIDAGHGGKDLGEVRGKHVEANTTLRYAEAMREALESAGYNVCMTRDSSNTDTYTKTNMYDPNGRISIACKSKAKLMLSFHVNNDALPNLTGFEIYSPCKSDLNFAEKMANNIKQASTINFSNNNTCKVKEGVYVRNYSADNIRDANAAAKRKGYEPYPLTANTPFLYTIREVGGLATYAYVDGRNKEYSKNAFYDSNHGIECYQIELGYIKNDMEIIENEMESIVDAIAESVKSSW